MVIEALQTDVAGHVCVQWVKHKFDRAPSLAGARRRRGAHGRVSVGRVSGLSARSVGSKFRKGFRRLVLPDRGCPFGSVLKVFAIDEYPGTRKILFLVVK
jgi:hypothetical protein